MGKEKGLKRWCLNTGALVPIDSRQGFEPFLKQGKIPEALIYVTHPVLWIGTSHAPCHTSNVGWGTVSRTYAEVSRLDLQIITPGLGPTSDLLFWLLKSRWISHTPSFPPHTWLVTQWDKGPQCAIYFQKKVEILVFWGQRSQAMTRLHFWEVLFKN